MWGELMDTQVTGLIKQIAPEAMVLLKQRYEILSAIQFNQPIGRRMLADKLMVSERTLRKELEFLHNHDFLMVAIAGVSLTEKAVVLLFELQTLIREILGLTYSEKELAEKLGLSKAVIVPGNSDADASVLFGMGRAAAGLIKDKVKANSIIAVMGGWTIARVTEMVGGHYPGVVVVPARGGLGEEVEIQANTVAAKLAERLGGSYKMLHVPENLDPGALGTLLADQRIKNIVAIIRNADILLYSIGRADIMARRRGLSKSNVARLLTKGAVAEALGNYYSREGKLVDRVPSLGIEIKDQTKLALSVAIAGGTCKAQAIVAALQRSERQVLVTDEGAAVAMLKILG